MSPTKNIAITVNGVFHRLELVKLDLVLLDLLHDELGLTGTKFGCGIGICRACTVAIRHRAGASLTEGRACLLSVSMLDGCEVTTVEGLAPAGSISRLQRAFLEAFAFQCGYCTPGFLMAAFVLIDKLKRSPVPLANLEFEIERAVGDHLCRCTGYRRYHRAIRDAIVEGGWHS